MSTSNGFPQELLNQSLDERRRYFQSLTIGHPNLIKCYKLLYDTLSASESNSLVFVFGPTGVGKTTLLGRLEQNIVEQLLPELESDPERIPIATLEASSPEFGNFNWKDFYKDLLRSLNEPCVDKKILHDPVSDADQGTTTYYKNKNRVAGIEYRRAAEQALTFRRPIAVLIDEAQHLGKISSGRKLQDQLDAIKSLANVTKTLIVLIGTYELLTFRNLSAQLSRRSVNLHFQRYQLKNSEEVKEFKNIVRTFQCHLPVAEEPDLIGKWDYLYERSIGCVGVLKNWLYAALSAALREGGNTITHKHLSKTALSVSQCENLLSDIVEGESKLDEKIDASSNLRLKLGLNVDQHKELPTDTKTSAKKKRRPGQRKPKRDPTGTDED